MPSVIEFPPPNLRGCFVAICAMGGTVVAIGAIALVLLLTGRESEGVALLAGWILCFPLGTAVFVYYAERKSRFLGRIEIQDDRITIRDDWRHQTIVVDSSTTFDWRSRSIVEGSRKYALRQLHCREVDQELLWRAIRRIVPADQQTDWEVFAYCRLVPRGQHVRELPPEAYFQCTRRTQASQRLVITIVCLIPFGILAYWIPYQAAIMSAMMLAVNAGFALLMYRETPREGETRIRLRWLLRYPGAIWAAAGLVILFAGVISRFFDEFLGPSGDSIRAAAILVATGLLLLGGGIAGNAQTKFQRKVAPKVVAEWETQWLQQDIDSPPAITPG